MNKINPITNFQSSNGVCSGTILSDGWNVVIRGEYLGDMSPTLKYLAQSPPDLRLSRSGSALPWANKDMAYCNTPNDGEVPIINGKFEITLVRPNGHYILNGSQLVPPHVLVMTESDHFQINLDAIAMPNRSLKSLPNFPDRSTHR